MTRDWIVTAVFWGFVVGGNVTWFTDDWVVCVMIGVTAALMVLLCRRIATANQEDLE